MYSSDAAATACQAVLAFSHRAGPQPGPACHAVLAYSQCVPFLAEAACYALPSAQHGLHAQQLVDHLHGCPGCPVHSKVSVVGGWPSPRTECVACSLNQVFDAVPQ